MITDIEEIFAEAEANFRDLFSRVIQLEAAPMTGIGGGGAPSDAEYLTLAFSPTLTAERVATAAWGIDFTDGGANSTLEIAVSQTELDARYLRFNRIVRMGATWTTYEKSVAGLTAALAAAIADDVIWLPPHTYTGDFTVPANVTLVGISRERCIIAGTVTLSADSILERVTINLAATSASAVYALLSPAAGDTAYVYSCNITATNTAGSAYAIWVFGRGWLGSSAKPGLVNSYVYGETADIL